MLPGWLFLLAAQQIKTGALLLMLCTSAASGAAITTYMHTKCLSLLGSCSGVRSGTLHCSASSSS